MKANRKERERGNRKERCKRRGKSDPWKEGGKEGAMGAVGRREGAIKINRKEQSGEIGKSEVKEKESETHRKSRREGTSHGIREGATEVVAARIIMRLVGFGASLPFASLACSKMERLNQHIYIAAGVEYAEAKTFL